MSKQKPDDWARLKHIFDALEKLKDFVEGMDENAFYEDEKTVFASIKLVEIIGEAVYHLSTELKEKYDSIPWKQIEGMRHKLVHDYYEIDAGIVWRVATVFAPQFGQDVQRILDDFE